MKILVNIWKPAVGAAIIWAIKRNLGALDTFGAICLWVSFACMVIIALTYIVEWALLRR